VAGGEVADVHRDPSERLHLHRLPLGEEAIDDTALVQHLDGAGVQTSGARAFEREAGASLDDEDVGPRQRQLRRQHHPRRTAAGDDNRMLGHTPLLVAPTFVRNSAPDPGACGKPRGRYYIEVKGVGPFASRYTFVFWNLRFTEPLATAAHCLRSTRRTTGSDSILSYRIRRQPQNGLAEMEEDSM